MADHLSDEQQLETIKRVWQEHGLKSILLVILVVGGWFSYQQWLGYKNTKAESGSLIYIAMMDLATQSQLAELPESSRSELLNNAALLKNDYANTQYAHYAGLLLAKLAVVEKRPEDAVTELQYILDNVGTEPLAFIARLRLARLEMGRENYDQALAVLEGETPTAMAASINELRGDIYLLRGDNVAARAAYQGALNAMAVGDASLKALLELKLNQVLPGQVYETTITEGSES